MQNFAKRYEIETKKGRKKDRDRWNERAKEREKKRQRQSWRERKRDRKTQQDRQTDRQTDRDNHNKTKEEIDLSHKEFSRNTTGTLIRLFCLEKFIM